MAGYVFNLGSYDSLKMYTDNGVYSTIMSAPKNNNWRVHHEGTFADYATMQPGDMVYFFIDRKIYGIGKLVLVGKDCKYLNFPKANIPEKFSYEKIRKDLLWDEGEESVNQRWICLFEPSPYFFKNGLDMDDVLASSPSSFKMLRAFWKVSFVKIDDEENQALMDVLLRANLKEQTEFDNEKIFDTSFKKNHERIFQKVGNLYKFNSSQILDSCCNGTQLAHEMALEAGILFQLSERDPDSIKVFGAWDYLSHQVISSPFKPIDYMDKMDVFGYSFIKGYPRTISDFLVMELKKDLVVEQDVEQLMKYVDWIKEEYSSGDFSMIKAFIVGHDFEEGLVKKIKKISERRFVVGRRPAKSKLWSNVKPVKYSYNSSKGKLEFNILE